MKINELGIFSQFEQLSPDVIRAQRLAELKNIAEYRARHLAFIKDWSDPVKRAAIQAEHAANERAAREKMAGEYIDDYRVRTVRNEVFIEGLLEHFKVKEIVKPVKRSWWQRFLDWFS